MKMDEKWLRDNQQSLEDIILDEERLVTYVSLSKDLCININSGKALMKYFVDTLRKKQEKTALNVKYLISGLIGDNQAKTTVCSEDDLSEVKKQFTMVFFEHIYSITKGKTTVDDVAFTALTKFQDLALCQGLIKNSNCQKRSFEEISHLKTSSQDISKPQANLPGAQPAKKIKVEKEVNKPIEPKTEKPEINLVKSEYNKDVAKLSNESKSESKSQKGIAGFFNKPNGVTNKKPEKEPIENKMDNKSKEQKETKKEPIPQVKQEKVKVEKMEVEETVTKTSLKNGNDKKEKNSKVKSATQKKNAKVDKKRKRVLQVSDSESDEEKDPFVDEPEQKAPLDLDSEDEIPPTPNVNEVKMPTGIINPRKRRKIVDKTYTDEDGYILTKKEEVYESCSDHEEEANTKENKVIPVQIKKEVSPKKAQPKNTKKKASPPQKGKQATLMSFFKKV